MTETIRTFGPKSATTVADLKPGQYFCRYDADFREHFSGKCAECGRAVKEGEPMEVTQAVDLTFSKPFKPARMFPQPTAPGEGIHCAEHMSR